MIVVYRSLQRTDLLQVMLNTGSKGGESELSTGEIVAEAVGFMLAGYETTSVAITFATYLLAKNPEVQEKLANGINEYFDENPVCDVSMCVCVCMHVRMYMYMCKHNT